MELLRIWTTLYSGVAWVIGAQAPGRTAILREMPDGPLSFNF